MKINELRKLIRDILSEVGHDTPEVPFKAALKDRSLEDPDFKDPKIDVPDQTLDIGTAKSLKRSLAKSGVPGSRDPLASIIGNSKKIDDPKKSPWGHYIEDWEEEDNKLKAQNAAANLQGAIKRLNPRNNVDQHANTVDPNNLANTVKQPSQQNTQRENKMKINELRNIIMEEYKNIKKEYNPNRALIKRIRHELDKVIFLLQEDEKETAIKLITRIKDMIDR